MNSEETGTEKIPAMISAIKEKIDFLAGTFAEKHGLSYNDIFNIGIGSVDGGVSIFWYVILIIATIAVVVIMYIMLSCTEGNQRTDTDKSNSIFYLIPIFSIIGFWIFPGFRLCLLGPLLGLILGNMSSHESKVYAGIWYARVPNKTIDKYFRKYRIIPRVMFYVTLIAMFLAAVFLPQELWSVKYHFIALLGVMISNIASFIQFLIIPFPSQEKLEQLEPCEHFMEHDGVLIYTQNDSPEKAPSITYESAMEELHKLIGMDKIKQDITTFANRIQLEKLTADKGKASNISYHILLTGNPGTGKTTLVRIIAKVFNAIGLLPTAHCEEVSRASLIGKYVGHTADIVTKACERAMGGILFIDEAYSLMNDERDSFGKEAIDTLLKIMEDKRGKFIVIAAGYEDEMRSFVNSNTGLKSRFNKEWHIDDYTSEELYEIALANFTEEGKELDDGAKQILKKLITRLASGRGTKGYANARLIRNEVAKTIERQADRISTTYDFKKANKKTLSKISSIITAQDIPFDEKPDVQDAFTKLDAMIGMNNLKEEIRNLAMTIRMDIKRNSEAKHPVHIVLTGNPGTGKTTVVRILAQLFNETGLLPENKVIEANRSKLVAGYIGQTAPKVDDACDRAMGGVLFIDEAYSLIKNDGNDFGSEAIDQLLIRMENNKGQFSVIVAGYKDRMEEFINSNPGLKSRFNYWINFDDYTPEEMLEIFISLTSHDHFILTEEVRESVHESFTRIYEHRTQNFANGRTVRNFYESVIQRLNKRVSSLAEDMQTGETLYRIEKEDVENIHIESFI